MSASSSPFCPFDTAPMGYTRARPAAAAFARMSEVTVALSFTGFVFGMTEARLRLAKPDVMIMHPGPMNRGVEIASEVADGPFSVILDQVANGVAVRMAVLYLLAGGAEHETAA